jgi:cytosine/adenosine deaminase-related metal-dependent hydrolase
MRKITATRIHPVSSESIPDGVIVLGDDGKILSIDTRDQHEDGELEKFEGDIVPGFINTHCHLELSHMISKVDTGTGLLPFLQNVVTFRDFPEEIINAAIEKADRDMFDAGIVAVGDISNKTDTFSTKANSSIRYYTFVEMFDFMQDAGAEATFNQYKAVFDSCDVDSGKDRKSCVPHAPYTVSKELFGKLRKITNPGETISIHNQETPAEDALFQRKSGGFIDFYKSFDISLDSFTPSGKNSIFYAMDQMDPTCKTLFVHNTLTSKADIEAAHAWSPNVYWATCANANLYIENRLPNYQYFLDADARMTIGTDSLTSNWQLSILEEMRTISRFQSYISFDTLLSWATINGAKALGFDDELGSIEKGKMPGLNLLNLENGKIGAGTKVRRLI